MTLFVMIRKGVRYSKESIKRPGVRPACHRAKQAGLGIKVQFSLAHSIVIFTKYHTGDKLSATDRCSRFFERRIRCIDAVLTQPAQSLMRP